jgi:lipoprotein-anchoring transpeptidase ErfK/SrfK
MNSRLAILATAAALVLVAASGARAALGDGADMRHGSSAAPAGLQLAQSGDVEVYYDGRGRRVLLDAWTGEIIAIEPPRRDFNRNAQRRANRARELGRGERYYLDDPDDVARLRRDMARERGYALPQDGIRTYPRETYPGDDGYAREIPPGDYGPDLYEEPEVVTRRPIEREPLPGAGVGIQPADPSQDTIVAPGQPAIGVKGREDVAALQILLDRAGASPGVIDGKFGSNVDKALAAYNELTGENLRSTDAAGIKAALTATGGDAFKDYTITPEDAAGPYVASVPADYGEKAKLERLSYTSTAEALAERFHMDEGYLKALNPEANFGRPGTIIKVANLGGNVKKEVARIVANKSVKQVRAYAQDGSLVAAYPATIGSSDTPSPTGTHMVSRVAFNPEYTYNPKLNFKQGNNDKVLTIPPGPNGPVGSIWIALDKPTYGIHGTPEPSKIGKTESHGCVRLTNWDAEELAKLVKEGVVVQFID